jgi:DNA-binding CsgD family transcriptional regulator
MLRLFAEGKTFNQVARSLLMSDDLVAARERRIRRRLQTSTVSESIIKAIALGYLSGEFDLSKVITTGAANISLGRSRQAAAARGGVLTSYQRQVLAAFADGQTYSQIADQLGTTRKSIESTLRRARKTFGVTTTDDLIVAAKASGDLDANLDASNVRHPPHR